MSTSSEIKQRANALAEKTDVNSITPKEVGSIMYDLASHSENVLRNGGTLGIRKVYESVAAMEADSTNPIDIWGNPIKKGNLVVIYDGTTTGVDNNKIYAFMNPGWQIATHLDAGYATKAETEKKLAELGSEMSGKATKAELQAEVTRATNAESALSKSIESETTRATAAELELRKSINNEIIRAKEAEEELENSINANRYGYNVTVNGLKGGVHTIETAIKDVPSKFRMLGQKITFRTEKGDWATYHNESLSLDNYENVNDWVQEVGISSVQGDVNITNAPDYEDLTEAKDGTIKFADKEYNKESFSGLGRVYLRKNIVEGIRHSVSIQVTSAPLYDGTLSIALNGVVYSIELVAETHNTISLVAEQIAKIADSRYNVSLDGSTITFVAKLLGEGLSTNIDSASGVGLDVSDINDAVQINQLVQDMFIKPNTIYIIQYDYDLQGAEITIPEGCVLDFQGGSFSNGTIVGNNTAIKAEINKIFSLNLELSGTWNILTAYSEWFGAKGDGVHDDRESIQKCINSFHETVLQAKVYSIYSSEIIDGVKVGLVIPYGKVLRGAQFDSPSSWIKTEIELDTVVYVTGSYIRIENVFINGGGVFPNRGKDGKANHGILTTSTKSLTFYNVNISYCKSHGFVVCAFTISMERCKSNHNGGEGFHIEYDNGRGTTLTMLNCFASSCNGTGYNIISMAYSTLISCACDQCGYNPEDSDFNNIGYGYKLTSCNTITLISCGQEGGYKLYKVDYTSNNINFISCRGVVGGHSDYDGTDIIDLDWAIAVSFKNCFWSIPKESIFIRTKNAYGYNVLASNCVADNNWVSVANGAMKKVEYTYFSNPFSVYFYDSPLVKIENNKALLRNNNHAWTWIGNIYKDGEIVDLLNNIGNISNYQFNKPILYKMPAGAQYWVSGSVIENINTSIKICKNEPNEKTDVYISKYTPSIINCQRIEFDGVTISVLPNALLEKALIIKNSTVVFKNCIFNIFTDGTLKGLFEAYNSTIVFDNCKAGTFHEGVNILHNSDNESNSFITIIGTLVYRSFSGFIANNYADITERRFNPSSKDTGIRFFDTRLKKPIWWDGSVWKDANGDLADSKKNGIFENKPILPTVGFAYFCTDRQTAEGTANGIMIYHKGNNVWVDALGRVVE